MQSLVLIDILLFCHTGQRSTICFSNRRVSIDETAVEFNISHDSAYNIVHDNLVYRKVCSRWVPRQLSSDHKCAQQTICKEHLDRHAHEEDAFCHQIVTGDKSWVCHYEPESKRWLMQWKHLSSLANKKIRDTGFRWESHAEHLLDVNGPVLVHFQKKGQTVTSARYSDMLVNKVKPAIRSKCHGLLSKEYCCFKTTPTPYGCAYSGYTTCSEIWGVETSTIQSGLGAKGLSLVWTYEEHLQGQMFADDNEVMEAVQSWLKAMPKSFFF